MNSVKGEAGETRPSGESPWGALSPTLHVFHSWDVIQAQATLPCQLLQQLDNMPSYYYFYFLIEVTDLKVHVLLVFLLGKFICPWKAFDFLRWSRPLLFFIYYVSKYKNYALKSTFTECKQPVFSPQTQAQSLGDGALLIKPSFSYKRHEWVNLGKGITSLILSTPRMHCK